MEIFYIALIQANLVNFFEKNLVNVPEIHIFAFEVMELYNDVKDKYMMKLARIWDLTEIWEIGRILINQGTLEINWMEL